MTKSVVGEGVVLYTPWTLDPGYRTDVTTRRILVIDPTWFDRLPVSDKVMNFIVEQGKVAIDELEVFAGDAAEIPGIAEVASVSARSHQTNQKWIYFVELKTAPKLFPNVSGYYKSFFVYWKVVGKSTT